MQNRAVEGEESSGIARLDPVCTGLLDLMAEAAWIHVRGRIRYVNPPLCRLLQCAAAELVDRDLAMLVAPPQDAWGLPAGGARRVVSLAWPCADGSTLALEVTESSVLAGEGDTVTLGILRPRAAEEPAGTSLDTEVPRLRSIFDSLAEGIVVLDAECRIAEADAAACRILGLTREQIEGRASIDPRWRAIHEDGSDFPGETHPSMHALRTGESSRNVVMGVHKPDGSLTWISINAEPVRGARRDIIGAVASFSDITLRTDAETRFMAEQRLNRQIIETSPLGICIYAESGECLAANPAMARDIGAALPRVLSQNFRELASWRQHGLVEAADKALHGGAPVRVEISGKTSFGKPMHLELHFCGLDLDGRRGLLLMTRDFADTKRAEEALARSESLYRSLIQ